MKQLFLTLFAFFTLNSVYGQVKATSSEINTGTDDDKFATAFALQGSKYLDQSGAKLSAVTAAGANTYTATLTPAITAYSSGQVFYIKITTANNGASTLNLNGLGAKALVKDVSTALTAGDLLTNKVYAVYYDGTNFQVMNANSTSNIQTLSLGSTQGNIAISGGNNISLNSLNSINRTNANALLSNGLYPYFNIAGSTNYPTTTGSGIALFRNASPSAMGSLDIWQPAAADYPYLRYGIGTTSFSNWERIATQDWTNATFAPLLGSVNYIQNQVVANQNAGLRLANRSYFAGGLDIGTDGTPHYSLHVGKKVTGAVTSVGIRNDGVIQSDVTTNAILNSTIGYTQAASFTLNNLYYSSAEQGGFGAGSTVTNQYGYFAGSSLTGATNNYGFYSNISAATNRWNFYANGTGANYFAGSLGIGTNVNLGIYKLDVSGLSNFSGAMSLNTGSDAAKGIVIKGFSATQSANLQEWQANTGANLAAIGGNGVLTSKGLNLSIAPVTSAATYDVLTRNTTTGVVEKVSSNAIVVPWTGVTSKPTTLTGYGITDAATSASVTTLDANVVHKTGNETIAGTKLFSTSIGIGTTNVHSYKLAVGGSMIAESVKVKLQANWPDYVFEKNYPMLPLNELEQFVLKNKHLPNIPTAEEVKKDGIELGEMNAKLLQKIEELTLYLIDLKKENETLKNRMDKLENKSLPK